MRERVTILAALLLLGAVRGAGGQSTPPPSFGKAQVVDVKSSATGASHRVWIVRPNGAPPASGFPVVYLLDASWYFNLTVEAAAIMMRSGDMPPAVIVGVGYEDGNDARRLRVRDFTTPAPASVIPPHFVAWKAEPGGAERFMRFVSDELRPMVAGGGSINPKCQVLVGHSLSGLYALESFLREPAGFRTYIIGDPSAWWNNHEPLRRIEGLAGRLAASGPVDVVVAQSTVPVTGQGIDSVRLRLSSIAQPGFTYEHRRFEGETHNSMLPGFLSMALRRGLSCGR